MVSKQAFNLEDGSVLKDLKDFFAASENTQNEDPSNNINYYIELLDEEKVKWIRSYGSSLCCIGWSMECYQTYDFFPSRFLHVLLLRLAFTFALPKTPSELDDGAAIVDVYSRKCTLWKNEIHWLMESGVEVMVEVVKQKRVVLVMVRGSRDQEVECGDILAMVVVKVAWRKYGNTKCMVLSAEMHMALMLIMFLFLS